MFVTVKQDATLSLGITHRYRCRVVAPCLLYNRIERLEGGDCFGRPDMHGSDVNWGGPHLIGQYINE